MPKEKVEVLGEEMRAYHFTSGVNWESIRAKGSLEPYSTPEIPLLGLPTNPYTQSQMQRIEHIIASNPRYWNGNFLVAIPESGLNGWKENELMDRVIMRCRDGITNKVVLLSFSVDVSNGSYIKDHTHFSPKRFIELYGKDLSDFVTLLLDSEGGEIERLLQQFELCSDSVIGLGDYNGSYQAPELWIAQPIPLNRLKLENQFDFWGYFRSKHMNFPLTTGHLHV
ncbi:hypothetical protein J4234_00100 [Candidatus Woesearchaeota archaeon]|nr:hypothetical protein [Candidatus Woesearchaeota archaeon]